MRVKLRVTLLVLSVLTTFLFIAFSYTVAKEMWQQFDFDTTVKIQDRTPRTYDELFSYFSLIGSAEFTMLVITVAAFITLFKKRILGFFSWFLMVPAVAIEILGKLLIYHPGTPYFMHRSIIEADLPSFYVHTNFSYPSGHMLRTVYIAIIFAILIFNSRLQLPIKVLLVAILSGFILVMAFTRIYLGEHWFSDVIGGILLGLAAGLFASIFIVGKNQSENPL